PHRPAGRNEPRGPEPAPAGTGRGVYLLTFAPNRRTRMNWLKRLFSMFESTDTSANRIEVALAGIASDLEEARGLLRRRLGLEGDGDDEAPTLEDTVIGNCNGGGMWREW